MAEIRVSTSGPDGPTLLIHFERVEPGGRRGWVRPVCHIYPEVRLERLPTKRLPPKRMRLASDSEIIRSGQRQGRSW